MFDEVEVETMILEEIKAEITKEAQLTEAIRSEVHKVLVGQNYILDRLLIGVLTGGHILLEGVPGLAKTLSIKTLASALNVGFKRIQFTPDLLPGDIVGTQMYSQVSQSFTSKQGPIFANFVLADEINRAPAKVQSALLEAMSEGQVTIGDETYQLPVPFLVLATQNPIDQEGTYPLAEAQMDRFLMKITVGYPSRSDEKEIVNRMTQPVSFAINAVASAEDLLRLQKVVQKVYVDEKIKDYVLDIVFATRDPKSVNLPDLANLLDFGASPRASISLIKAAKAHAFLQGRAFVTPEDIKAIGKDVLRHRVLPSFEAEADHVDSDAILDRIFSEIEVP